MGASRKELEARLAELSDEVRRYPTPIARCDQQLTELLEQRARLLARLELLDAGRAGGCTPLAVWANDGGAAER
jgi:hypothetical protein